jgi:hypothetical protein
MFRMPPCRRIAISSMLSAPATMPATSEDTFKPGLAPLSVGTVKNSSDRVRSPTSVASFITGDQPGRRHEIRFVKHR